MQGFPVTSGLSCGLPSNIKVLKRYIFFLKQLRHNQTHIEKTKKLRFFINHKISCLPSNFLFLNIEFDNAVDKADKQFYFEL